MFQKNNLSKKKGWTSYWAIKKKAIVWDNTSIIRIHHYHTQNITKIMNQIMQQWEQKSDLTLYLVMIVKYQDLSIYHQFAYNTGKNHEYI